jgi:hypothetical protein
MTILSGWPLEISIEEIIRGQGMDSKIVLTGKPTLVAAAKRASKEGMNLLHPVAIFQEMGIREHRHNRIILENAVELNSAMVASHLVNAQRIFAVICTIGYELEDKVSELLGVDPPFALALDGLGNAAIEVLSQKICAHIGEQILVGDLTASTPLAPGNPGWPMEIGQPEIFLLLEPSKCGVTLTGSGMMVPKKSMSFVIGIGPDMPGESSCFICSLKDTCRYQHV